MAGAVIAKLATSLFLNAGLSAGISMFIARAVVGFAISSVLGAVSKALVPKPKQQDFSSIASNRTITVRQPITYRRTIYGQARVGGPYTFLHTTESNKYLHMVITLAEHECEELGDIYFNDELVPLDGSGNATGRYAGYVTVKKGLGTTAGDSDWLNTLISNTGGKWTSAHRQTGCAKLYIRLQYNQDLFPSGIPNITCIVKGKKLYDPRTGLTVYSNNAALAVRDHLLNKLKESSARINDTSFSAEATICDESVNLNPSGTESRYTCNGTVDSNERHKEVIQALLTASSGKLAHQGGKWNLYTGAYRTPTITLDEDSLDGPISVTSRLSRRELFNAVKGVYVSPQDLYQPTDFPPVTNATYLAEDQGERIWKDINLPFTTSSAMAQRLAKIDLEAARQQMSTVWPCKLSAIGVQAGAVVNLTNTRMGWSAKPFEVVDFKLAVRGSGDNIRLGIDLFLRETASTVYDWNSGEETTVDPAPNTTLPNPFTVLPPGIPLVMESLYDTKEGGGVKARATVSWTHTDEFATHGQVEHKLTSSSTYIVHPRTANTSYNIDDLAPGIYDFRVKCINSLGVSSAYSGVVKEILGLSAKPSALTGLTIQSAGGLAILQWSRSVDLDVRAGGKIEFRHSREESGAVYSATVSIGDAITGDQTVAVLPLLPGTYFAIAVDSSGIASDPATVSTAGAQVLAFSPLSSVIEHTGGFNGSHSGTVAADGILKLAGASLIDSWANIDSVADWDSEGGVTASGTYTFETGLDLTTQQRVRLRVDKAVQEINTEDLIDGRTALIDTWASIDGVVGGETDMQVWVRATNDDPTGSPTWGAWEKLHSGEYYMRAFQFQSRLSTSNADYNIQVSELTVTAENI